MYAAIRCYDPTVPPATVLEYSPESGRSIRQTYRVLIRELDLPTPPPDPLEYVDRIADAMDCDSTVRERAEEIVGAVKERTRNRALCSLIRRREPSVHALYAPSVDWA